MLKCEALKRICVTEVISRKNIRLQSDKIERNLSFIEQIEIKLFLSEQIEMKLSNKEVRTKGIRGNQNYIMIGWEQIEQNICY